MELDALIRGQSNAFLLLAQSGEDTGGNPPGAALLQSEVQRLLGFDGVNDRVHLDYDWWTPGAETIFGSTAFIGDWMQQTANGWQPLDHEQALLNHIRLNPHPDAASNAVVWFHSEYDSTNPNLTAEEWMSAVQTDASLVRQAMGRDAASSPYLFVSAIPFQGASDATTQAIRIGMEQLAADPAFNAAIAAHALDLDMSYTFPNEPPMTGFGRAHMSPQDAALVAERIARTLADEWAAYAKPGSPVALAGGHIDAAGPEVIAANLVAPDTLRLTVLQDHSAGLATLDPDAVAGIGWSVRSGDSAVSADHAEVLSPDTLQLHFTEALPAGGRLFYGYGYGRLAQGDQPGEGNAIYDADGLPIWAPAQGVPVTDGTAITGTAGDDRLVAGAGRNSIDGLAGHDWLDLQTGGHRGDRVSAKQDGSVLLVHADQVDTLHNVEEVHFLDGRLVLDQAAPAAQVVRLYQAALGRTPDQDGLDNWTTLIEHGTPLKATANGFLGSAEFQSRFGAAAGPDDGAFIDQLYQNVLHRSADAEGKANWTTLLANHSMDRADVLIGFSESPENQANTAPLTSQGVWVLDETAAELARLYDTVLGRLPDQGGLANWKAQIEGGALGLKGAAEGFMGSQEFLQTFGGLGNADFVETLYQHTLHRGSDPGGKASWVNALDAHSMDRADVVLGFSESPEHIANTAPNIMNPNPADYGILFA